MVKRLFVVAAVLFLVYTTAAFLMSPPALQTNSGSRWLEFPRLIPTVRAAEHLLARKAGAVSRPTSHPSQCALARRPGDREPWCSDTGLVQPAVFVGEEEQVASSGIESAEHVESVDDQAPRDASLDEPALFESLEEAAKDVLTSDPRAFADRNDSWPPDQPVPVEDFSPQRSAAGADLMDEPSSRAIPDGDAVGGPWGESKAIGVGTLGHSSEILEQGQGDVVLEWLTPSEVSVGQHVHCELRIRNTESAAVQDVVVRAAVSKHVELQSARPEPKREAEHLVWSLGEIEAHGARVIELELTPQAEGEIAPRATVSFSRMTAARIQVLKAALDVAIDGPQQVVSGQPVNYQLIVRNPGQGRAHNVVIQVTLGEHLTSPDGEQVSYSIGALGPGESRNVQLAIRSTRAGVWPLAVRATGAGNLSAQCQCSIEVVRPRLEVAIEGPRLRYVERQATYTIRVHNPGPAPANNVQVFDAIPASFRFLDASGGGAFDHTNRQVAWFVGRLEPGATAELGVQLIPTEIGDAQLAAEVKADCGVVEKAEAQTRVEGIAAVVIDVADTDDPVEVGGQTAYEIRVTNRGSQPARMVQVAAKLSGSMEAIDASGPTQGTIDGGQVVFEPIATLEPGQSQLYRVVVHCPQAGQMTFRAYFRSAEQPKPVVEEEVTRVYQD